MIENKIILGDCLEILPTLPSESMDLIVTDPPYNSTLEWDKKTDEFQFRWLAEAKRLLKDGGSLYMFFAPLNSYGVEGFIRENFNLRNIIIWHHPNLYGANLTYGRDRWKSTWEVIYYATKGQSEHLVAQKLFLMYGRSFDVINIPAITKNRLHKAQKPLKLIEMLIWASSNQGDLILDPFVGSGTTCLAAKMLKRHYLGIEVDPAFYEIAVERVEKGMVRRNQHQLNLFEGE